MKALRFLVLVLALASAPASAIAEEPLRLTEVLESVVATHPKLAKARAEIERQQGRQLAATRSFEPVITGAASAVPYGYYDYWQLAAAVEQRIPNTGAKVLGGYRLGLGEIPSYYGERKTRDGGELFAKIKVPLLADRALDKERAEIAKSEMTTSQASFEMATSRLELARKASLDYWEWVASGQKLRVANELYRIAEERAVRIREQVSSGASPKISAVDADRVLLSRRTSVLQARGKFASTQQKLSLSYRTADNTPRVANLKQVPQVIPSPPAVSSSSIQTWIDAAIQRRPELRVAETVKRQAQLDLKLARNRRLPSLDANAFVARDLGAGSESLGQTDVGIGLSLSIPLFQREGRGLRKQAQAKLASVAAEQRGLRDRIAASIRQSVQLAIIAGERMTIAQERLVATETLAEGERERLRQGASDLLTLNLRELDVAAAAKEVIESRLDAHRAAVELVYARAAGLNGSQP